MSARHPQPYNTAWSAALHGAPLRPPAQRSHPIQRCHPERTGPQPFSGVPKERSWLFGAEPGGGEQKDLRLLLKGICASNLNESDRLHVALHSALSGRGLCDRPDPSTSRGSVLGYLHSAPCGAPDDLSVSTHLGVLSPTFMGIPPISAKNAEMDGAPSWPCFWAGSIERAEGGNPAINKKRRPQRRAAFFCRKWRAARPPHRRAFHAARPLVSLRRGSFDKGAESVCSMQWRTARLPHRRCLHAARPPLRGETLSTKGPKVSLFHTMARSASAAPQVLQLGLWPLGGEILSAKRPKASAPCNGVPQVLVAEVADAGKGHGHAQLVGGFNHLGVVY